MALDPKEFSAVVKVRAGKVYPDWVNSPVLRLLPKDMAEAEGWPTFADGAPCANGHVSPKFCKNSLCVDCWRVRQKRETIHPRAKDKKYYKQRDPAALTANGAPVVIAPSPSAEPSKGEEKLFAAIAEHRDIDAGCAAVGWTRAEFEARRASSDVFRKAAEDLIARLDIKQTRAPDPEDESKWTPTFERQFAKRLIDCGLVEQVRQEFKVSASDYQDRLEKSTTFSDLIESAQPLADATLYERSLQAAATGNDKLLKILNDAAEAKKKEGGSSYSNMSHEQMNAEIMKLLPRFLFSNPMRHTPTGQLINFRDLDYEMQDSAPDSNSDLVSE